MNGKLFVNFACHNLLEEFTCYGEKLEHNIKANKPYVGQDKNNLVFSNMNKES